MQFLKILFWCLLAFVAALFTYGNWVPVRIQLWNNLVADINLPLLLLITFLLGLLPTLLYHHAVRWRLRSRLGAAERSMENLRTTMAPPAAPIQPAPPPIVEPAPIPLPPPDLAAS